MTPRTRTLPVITTNIAEAAACLRASGLVAFPTETVYGLGGCARDDLAVAKIYAAKDRPRFNPLIVHYAAPAEVFEDVEISSDAEKLAECFWPGPLTLVLPRRRECALSRLVSAGLSTVAVRVPDHPLAQSLLIETGEPVAAPSANRSGTISPTCPEHVVHSLETAVDMILDGGATPVGLESTVVDLTGAVPTLLRPGGLDSDRIADCLGKALSEADDEDAHAPKSPGRLDRHYAPQHSLRLNAKDVEADEALIAFGPAPLPGAAATINLSPSGNIVEAASHLYAALHEADALDVSGIAVMPIPNAGLGRAINDRLGRAAHA